MEARSYTPHLAVIGLMALTSLALALTVDVRVSDVAGVKAELPDRVGDWTGHALRYCQAATCQQEFSAENLASQEVCPACGGKLGHMSFLEARLLPQDTVLAKKRYTNSAGRALFASIVLSGRERASIHRPEVCLVGQGSEIVDQSILAVPVADRPTLKVKVLDMLHRRGGPGAASSLSYSYYAYWFVGHGRETPEHWQRMFWMASDRVLHGIAHRWAYIAVAGPRAEGSGEYREQARAFIGDLYPQILTDEERRRAGG
jgi:hypothetical protein